MPIEQFTVINSCVNVHTVPFNHQANGVTNTWSSWFHLNLSRFQRKFRESKYLYKIAVILLGAPTSDLFCSFYCCHCYFPLEQHGTCVRAYRTEQGTLLLPGTLVLGSHSKAVLSLGITGASIAESTQHAWKANYFYLGVFHAVWMLLSQALAVKEGWLWHWALCWDIE